MSIFLPFVLAAMSALAPGRDHTTLGGAIASVIDEEPALFTNDENRHRSAALVVAVAFREGSLGTRVEGDIRNGKPISYCTMQIAVGSGRTPEGWTGPELRDDPVKCVTVGVRMLRTSMRICPSAPLAFYAEGPNGCTSERAKRISRDRMALAKRVLVAAEAALAKEGA